MFFLAPHPHLAKPRRGSPRMFRIDWVETYFTRVKWWHVPLIWTPVAILCVRDTLLQPESTVGLTAGVVAAGIAAWTLLEYVLHRYLFHFAPNPAKTWQVDLHWLIHGIHHDYPWDPDRLVMPPFATLVLSLLLWPLFRAVGGPVYGTTFYAGVLLGYMTYDLLHYYVHHAVPTTAVGRWLRRYHLLHHFASPELRYGITTPLWDLVFGTAPRDKAAGLDDAGVSALEDSH